MKDEAGGVSTKKLARLNAWCIAFCQMIVVILKEAKGVNKNVAARVCYNEQKDVLFNNKLLKHSMDRIQSKNKVETCEINKKSLSWFDDKMYILNTEYDGLALGYQS